METSAAEEAENSLCALFAKNPFRTPLNVAQASSIEVSTQVDSALKLVTRLDSSWVSLSDHSTPFQYFVPGQQVSLAPGFRTSSDARNGPLRPGDIGVVVTEVDKNNFRYVF